MKKYLIFFIPLLFFLSSCDKTVTKLYRITEEGHGLKIEEVVKFNSPDVSQEAIDKYLDKERQNARKAWDFCTNEMSKIKPDDEAYIPKMKALESIMNYQRFMVAVTAKESRINKFDEGLKNPSKREFKEFMEDFPEDIQIRSYFITPI